MAFKLANNVQETTSTSGTADYALLGPVSNALAISSQLSAGDTTFYAVWDDNDVEVGEGTFTTAGGDTLSRDTILFSTNAGAKVSWPSSGARNVVIGVHAAALESLLDPSAGTGLVQRTAKNVYTAIEIFANGGTIPQTDQSNKFTVDQRLGNLIFLQGEKSGGGFQDLLGISNFDVTVLRSLNGDFVFQGPTTTQVFEINSTGDIRIENDTFLQGRDSGGGSVWRDLLGLDPNDDTVLRTQGSVVIQDAANGSLVVITQTGDLRLLHGKKIQAEIAAGGTFQNLLGIGSSDRTFFFAQNGYRWLDSLESTILMQLTDAGVLTILGATTLTAPSETAVGSGSAPDTGHLELSNGALFNYGVINVAADTLTTQTFSKAFPNTTYHAMARVANVSGASSLEAAPVANVDTSAQLEVVNNSDSARDIAWSAVATT